MSTDTAASFSVARRTMIDSQLRPSGVNAPWVLAAMARLPREDFVPEAARAAAYMDRAVPLGDGHFLAPPLVHGRMLDEAAPVATDTALVVSDGNDYLAQLLRPAVAALTVFPTGSVPIDTAPSNVRPPLLNSPYSLILIDGAIEELPTVLADALAEGGRLVTGLISHGVTHLALGHKSAGQLVLHPLADLAIPPIARFAAPKRWAF